MANSPTKQPMRPSFPVDSLPLNLIDLDLRNSRFPRDAQSQTDALELMLTTSGDDCLELLRDLTRTGRMNSSDLPIVVERDGRYVMMEGNRRLTCLRLWNEPSLLKQDETLENQFLSRVERLVEDSGYNPPTELRVSIAPTEEDAEVWIDRKHSGGSGGAGTVEWGAAMKDRRRARNDPTKASRAMAFAELVSREYAEEPDVLVALESVRNARYTFIQRFVDRSVVRDMIGLEFSEGKMSFQYGSEPTKPIIRQVLNDFAQPKAESGKTWARELDTVEDFRNYLTKYSSLLPGRKPDGVDTNLGNFTGQGGSENGTSGTSKGGSTGGGQAPGFGGENSATGGGSQSGGGGQPEGNDPRPPRPQPARERIFREVVLDKFTPRIQEMVRQTSLLSVQRQNETVSVMLRVILDLTAYQFLLSHGESNIQKDLDKRIKQAIKIIDPQASDALGTAENTPPLRKAFHYTTADNIRLTQYAVHDIHNGRTPAEVITLADRYAPVLSAMNSNMGNHSIQ